MCGVLQYFEYLINVRKCKKYLLIINKIKTVFFKQSGLHFE